jgi:hypothetical protein
VLTPPEGLPEDLLTRQVADGWGITASSVGYRPVGFGSHHWEITDSTGTRWFVTADDLANKRHSQAESLDAGYQRVRASLAAATALAGSGCAFVAAPVPARDGQPLARAGEQFAIAVYRFIDGQSFPWGDFSTPEHRQAMLAMIVAVHAAPAAARQAALPDDFMIPHRDALEAALRSGGRAAEHGPYSRPVAGLMAGHAAPIGQLLARYDELAADCRARPQASVLTHGETHPGNTMRTAAGWLLIDWDTALTAPPERDLWNLDPGDGSILAGYAAATGVTPSPGALELYRIRWDLADLAVDSGRFSRPHAGTPEDQECWELLRKLVTHLSG